MSISDRVLNFALADLPTLTLTAEAKKLEKFRGKYQKLKKKKKVALKIGPRLYLCSFEFSFSLNWTQIKIFLYYCCH